MEETQIVADHLRLDHGTETTEMSSIHMFMHKKHGTENPDKTVIYGKSTSNQVVIAVAVSRFCFCSFFSHMCRIEWHHDDVILP